MGPICFSKISKHFGLFVWWAPENCGENWAYILRKIPKISSFLAKMALKCGFPIQNEFEYPSRGFFNNGVKKQQQKK